MTVLVGQTTNDLQVACEELNRRGCSARLRDVRYCGEHERRLVVRRSGGRVAVELLAPLENEPADCWHAVRIDREGRTVWCGPLRSDVVSGLDLVQFVLDLLHERESTVARKHRRCDPE